MQILVDTNLLLRAAQPNHPQRSVALAAMRACRTGGYQLALVPQVIYEFWVVATRPEVQNGLGLPTDEAHRKTSELLLLFDLLRDERAVFDHWYELVRRYEVQGKNAHDARIVAAAQRHGIDQLLTFNVGDFARYGRLAVLHPVGLADGTVTLPAAEA